MKLIIADSVTTLASLDWLPVPGTGLLAAMCPDDQVDSLPSTYNVAGYEHVTNLVATTHFERDCIGVYYQDAPGHNIEFDII